MSAIFCVNVKYLIYDKFIPLHFTVIFKYNEKMLGFVWKMFDIKLACDGLYPGR